MYYHAFICPIQKHIQLGHSCIGTCKQSPITEVSIPRGLHHLPWGSRDNLIYTRSPPLRCSFGLGDSFVTSAIFENHSSWGTILF